MVDKIIIFTLGALLSALVSLLISYCSIFVLNNMLTGTFIVLLLSVLMGCLIYFYNKKNIAFALGIAFGRSAMMVVAMLFVSAFGG